MVPEVTGPADGVRLMIRLNGRGAAYGEVWYGEEPPRDPGVDIVLYRHRPAPPTGAESTSSLSLVTDLSVGEDAMRDQFGKDCRYKIRRAETRDRLHTEFIVDPERRLDEFRAFYDSFARQKSVGPSDHRWLVAACRVRRLAMSSASRDGEALVWHAYFVSGTTARLEYTGSSFRDRENEYRALVGRANRLLHWRDMLQFKEMGIRRYDWGGIFEDESVPENAGINRFKKEFGGRQERTYDCAVPVTLKGRIYLPLRNAWRRRRSARPGATETAR
ncbi:MAG TPA: GNAT family N-acetyltransferase [Burkholderiales bacterium]|nr:GNAT family N-acetyltransferase [Burkholderiales bacterium]